MGQALVQQHRLDAAVAEFQRAITLSGHSPAYDADQALHWLDQVYGARLYGARLDPVILVRPQFDPLRSDPRFKEFMRRLRLGN